MAAETLAQGGVSVDLYEAMPWPGRKFLVAGKGGLNLTHSEPFERFLSRYGARSRELEPYLAQFGPQELRDWIRQLGFETFVGTSGRIFPSGMKASPLLRAWLQRLTEAGVIIHTRHRWLGWDEAGALEFETPAEEKLVQADALVLALGGGSRPRLGSNAAWVPLLRLKGVRVNDLKPSNCGFDVNWSEYFHTHFEGQPVRPVVLAFIDSQGNSFRQQGEFIITRSGLEGSLIYAASALLREEIEASGWAEIRLDLAPDWSMERLVGRLAQPRGKSSTSSHLKKVAGIQGVKAGLLWEMLPKEVFQDADHLAAAIKSLPIILDAARPLEEAISSAGGISFESLDEGLMLRDLPGVFCAGEMLDWEAPTGGYLLTACFSSGRAAGQSALDWLTGIS
ncbi:MAG TPA: aminoacetone oxidase family FAD-binding enzyme [Anaerolineae bacterium]|nr:aminoacetone oxidase family FAD-binding enzyme [Anaerolineae bacterium]